MKQSKTQTTVSPAPPPVGGPLVGRRMGRRTFLRSLSLAASTLLLVACGPPRGDQGAAQDVALGAEATPQTILPSPMPDAAVPTEALAGELTLEQFLSLSALLTGVRELSPTLGEIYLRHLGQSTDGTTLAALGKRLGVTDAASTSATERFDPDLLADESLRKLAETVAKLWYTGTYSNEAGDRTVVTYVDALAWRTLAFTKPKTICGQPGFWAEAWEPVLN